MKFHSTLVTIILAGLLTAGLSACSTPAYQTAAPWQGKLWRGVVVKTIVDTTIALPGLDAATAMHFDAHHDIGLRLTRVHIATGFNSVLTNAALPDSIAFADVPRGTLVDIVTVAGPDIDFSQQRFTRIIGVVCNAYDEACLDREKAAGRVNAILDDHPADQTYGLTYNVRETKADVKQYN